jgi:hypothetical protein
VGLEEDLGFLALAGTELYDLSASGSNQDLASFWVLADALDLRVEGLDVWVPEVARSLLGKLAPGEAPDNNCSILAARN